MMKQAALVVALTGENLALFELGIVAELFGLPREELGVPWYRFEIVGAAGGASRALGGLSVSARHGLARLAKAHTIVIPGWSTDTAPPLKLLRALRAAHARGARFMSICSGAFLLAHAGLLDGRRATTHWRYCALLAERFPAVEVLPDVLYVDEGQIVTSAGSAAGIDAGLHLIHNDYGAAIANQVARRLVVTPQRSGGQRQFIPAPVYAGANRKFDAVLEWALERLAQPLTLGAMAAQAAMSERNFLRRFAETTGMTPMVWLQGMRIAASRELLEAGDVPLAQVAERCGFASFETFRAAFRREVGVAPSVYRQRFMAAAHKGV